MFLIICHLPDVGDFILRDVRAADGERHLMMATADQLEMLKESEIWQVNKANDGGRGMGGW